MQPKRTQDLIFAFLGTSLVLLFVFKSNANGCTMRNFMGGRHRSLLFFLCVYVCARQFKEFQTKPQKTHTQPHFAAADPTATIHPGESIKSFSVDMKITLLCPFANTRHNFTNLIFALPSAGQRKGFFPAYFYSHFSLCGLIRSVTSGYCHFIAAVLQTKEGANQPSDLKWPSGCFYSPQVHL